MGHHRVSYLNWNFIKPQILHTLNLSVSKKFWGSFLHKALKSRKKFKPLWRLRSGRETVIHHPSKNKGLRDIWRIMRMVIHTKRSFLGVNSGYRLIFGSLWHFITKCDRYHYKMQQLYYYKMRQNFVTKCIRFFISKSDSSQIRQLLQNASILLQNATFITKGVVGTAALRSFQD